ncbi:MAG: ATP-dependent zinc metalloprotease FtsH [Oscillospiraceae bacterium]|nr:ATP-dependent zinc metalloprotease FtsH [Oscillospiraceae bacterium]
MLALYTFSNSNRQQPIPYSEAVSLFEQQQVKSFSTKDKLLTMELYTPYNGQTSITCKLASTDYFREDLGELIRAQTAAGTLEEYDYQPDTETPWILTILPYLLVGVAVVFLFVYLTNRSGGNNPLAKFGKANARVGIAEDKRVTFDDVAGADEEKEELREIVDFLRDPEKYTAIGARIPKGVLLVGPPGTGKTLIAKAVAGEANVQFLSISGSDFVEMYVGVGASRVRDLFETAKKLAPSIVFIDEIDAVGRKRGAGLGGGHDEREQTLNQLLVEMDGFGQNEGVIVIAATNRKDILDPALLRPGRFDRQVYVGVPDSRGREAILKVHSKDKPLADTVSLKTIAQATGGFTGADLANLLNEAALLAARDSRPVVAMDDLEEAMMKVLAGPQKISRVMSAHERRLTAVHEAGHAVAMYHLPAHDPVHQITIIPRGGAGGMTLSLPDHDQSYASRNQMFEDVVALLGGRIAESMEMGDISTGASSDLQRATGIARDMVAKYGMSARLGAVSYEQDGEVFIGRDYEKTKSYSERVAGEIDEETKVVVDEAYEACHAILEENQEKLRQVAQYLLQHSTMDRDQFEACMEGREIPEVSTTSIFDAPVRGALADPEA